MDAGNDCREIKKVFILDIVLIFFTVSWKQGCFFSKRKTSAIRSWFNNKLRRRALTGFFPWALFIFESWLWLIYAPIYSGWLFRLGPDWVGPALALFFSWLAPIRQSIDLTLSGVSFNNQLLNWDNYILTNRQGLLRVFAGITKFNLFD